MIPAHHYLTLRAVRRFYIPVLHIAGVVVIVVTAYRFTGCVDVYIHTRYSAIRYPGSEFYTYRICCYLLLHVLIHSAFYSLRDLFLICYRFTVPGRSHTARYRCPPSLRLDVLHVSYSFTLIYHHYIFATHHGYAYTLVVSLLHCLPFTPHTHYGILARDYFTLHYTTHISTITVAFPLPPLPLPTFTIYTTARSTYTFIHLRCPLLRCWMTFTCATHTRHVHAADFTISHVGVWSHTRSRSPRFTAYTFAVRSFTFPYIPQILFVVVDLFCDYDVTHTHFPFPLPFALRFPDLFLVVTFTF